MPRWVGEFHDIVRNKTESIGPVFVQVASKTQAYRREYIGSLCSPVGDSRQPTYGCSGYYYILRFVDTWRLRCNDSLNCLGLE